MGKRPPRTRYVAGHDSDTRQRGNTTRRHEAANEGPDGSRRDEASRRTGAVHWRPFLPDLRVLPDGAVAAAWDVAQHAVVSNGLAVRQFVRGEAAGVVVHNHEIGAVEALGLVRQCVATLEVRVVGNHQTGRGPNPEAFLVEHFNDLRRLGPRCGAHVEHLHRRGGAATGSCNSAQCM